MLLTESVVEAVSVEVRSKRADTCRVEVLDVVLQRHPELSVWIKADVKLLTMCLVDQAPLGRIVRPGTMPLAMRLAPRVAQPQQPYDVC